MKKFQGCLIGGRNEKTLGDFFVIACIYIEHRKLSGEVCMKRILESFHWGFQTRGRWVKFSKSMYR